MFDDGERMTTTDALQIQWRYCRAREGFEYKSTKTCTSKDKLGFENRDVFVDRICDGFSDCGESEDELGGLGECANAGTPTPGGCCETVLIHGAEYVYNGGSFRGADTWVRKRC